MPLLPLALRRDPVDVLACLAAEPGALHLEVPDPVRPLALLGCRPVAELRVDDDVADPLAAIAAFVADTPVDAGLPFPLGGGVVALLAYELGVRLAPRPIPCTPAGPLAVLRRYDPLLVYDRARRQYALLSTDPARTRAPWLERLSAMVPAWYGPLGDGRLAPRWTADRYRDAVARILALLAAGDCYQVDLTHPFTTRIVGPAWALHARLLATHPVPHAAYVDLGDAQVVCNSPELLLRRRGPTVETRPIKGTRPRAADPARDAALAADLRADAKERAEHVMIVDLERNDLGRVCRPGSVHVAPMAAVERHATVQHLVSSVRGALRDDVDLPALLAAVFPGGSVTGAPKQRAMEVIATLEDEPRGLYTGALGLLHPGGDCELALPIRTAVIADGTLTWRAGGGIVADSDPAREWAETWLKTTAVRRALGEPAEAGGTRCSSG
jgi:anthranilate/para-aminobenzoate synthase component I